MGFPKFITNHESQCEFQLIVSEILDHHNQVRSRNLHFKFLLSIYLLKKLTVLWRFYTNITGCEWITNSLTHLKMYIIVNLLFSHTGIVIIIVIINNSLLIWNNFIRSLKENIILVKLFETSFVSNILVVSRHRFFSFTRMYFQVYIQGSLLHN